VLSAPTHLTSFFDLLGASAWESFAFAYLILECEFIPTGLSTGRTLPIADIVGRRRSDGSRRNRR
jgi:hypothetical protein